MYTVIRGTKTIDEFKAVRAAMEQAAAERSAQHRAACEDWTHGEPEKVWKDGDGTLCIEYEDGAWWHYGDNGEWW
jgi:hypothetical protein